MKSEGTEELVVELAVKQVSGMMKDKISPEELAKLVDEELRNLMALEPSELFEKLDELRKEKFIESLETKEGARAFLNNTGIYDKQGNLTDAYKIPFPFVTPLEDDQTFWWQKNPKPKLGISCRSKEDIEFFANRPEFDYLELKIVNMSIKGFHILDIKDDIYTPNKESVDELGWILNEHSKPFFFHMPFGGGSLLKGDRHLYHARREDHDAIENRFRGIAGVNEILYNKGICVSHLAEVMVKKKDLFVEFDEKEVFKNAKELYMRLDRCAKEENWPIQITFENSTSPKSFYNALGYKSSHYYPLLGETKNIGITIDTGHANLAPEEFGFRTVMGSLPLCSVHFHGNAGEFREKSYRDDEHKMATKDNVRGYDRWITTFKRLGIPVTLELKRYPKEEIISYAQGLRKELGI